MASKLCSGTHSRSYVISADRERKTTREEDAVSNTTLAESLGHAEILSVFSPDELEQIAAQAERLTYDLGDTIFNAGEPGTGLFVVLSGSVRVFNDENGKEISIGVRREGDAIAEIAALGEYHHESSARASAKTELIFIPRTAIASLLSANRNAKSFIARCAMINATGGFVRSVLGLQGKVERDKWEDLVCSIGVMRVMSGQVVLAQGDREDQNLYLLRRGRLGISRSENGKEYSLGCLQPGDIAGEAACLLRQEQLLTVVAESESVLLVIPWQTVEAFWECSPKLKANLHERINLVNRELERQKKVAERPTNRLLLDLATEPRLGERIIKRFPLVEQAEETDCGAACLAMISRHYGIPITLGKLREMAKVTTEGATLDSLASVGELLGFTTRGLQCTYEGLLGLELPLIAHWQGYHYIIVYGVSKQYVWIADPALGFRKLPVEEFDKGWTGTCLLFSPSDNMVEITASRSPWVRFVRLLRPHKSALGYLLMATAVIEALSLVPPIILQNILDRVVVHQNYGLLTILLVGFLIAMAFTQLTRLLRTLLSNFMMRSLDFSMMSHFFKHTLSLPVEFFAKRRTGDIFARFQENQTIRDFLTESTVSTVLNLLVMFLYFIVMFIYNAKMALLLILMIIPLALLTLIITPRIKQYARRDFEASTDAEAMLMEILNGSETVKAMGIERSMRRRWEKRYAKALNVQYQAQRFEALVGLASRIMYSTITIVLLWVGASLVLSQKLTVGQLIAFNILVGNVLAPVMGLIGLWDKLHEAGVAMAHLGDVLDLEPEQKPEDLRSRILLPDLRGDIRFEGVYYRYGGSESPYVLENVSLELNAGETIAIVGHSGSGKSTIAKLLAGFFVPTEGKITVDGYDLNLLDKEHYRNQIGYVMQSNLLFSGTIAENIALGEDNPDRRRLVEVAKLADAHGFVSRLPLGYEQVVGERGVGLSGGQIQRVCIARALYHNPRLLIFDEATSALDTQSETSILNNMQEVLEGRTAVVIAHRLSTVMNADKILVLYQGRAVEAGVHQELLDRQGMYYQLVKKQIAA
jgi:ATP-binding cassette subfamily B protein